MSPTRRVVATVGTVATLLIAAAPSFAATPTQTTWASKTGIAIPGTRLAWGTEAQLAIDLDRVAASGATWLRFDVPWSQISWEPGQADWSRVDRIVAEATARGLKPLGILNTLAPYARPAGTTWQYGPQTDAQRSAFAAFAGQAATRYAGKVNTWEVWNEPNLDQFWAPVPSPAEYSKLLAVTTPAIRSGCPTCTILAGGTGGSTGLPDIDPLTWYKGVYAQKANRWFDAVAVHPYSDRSHGWGGEMSVVPAIRTLMDQNGDGTKSVWGTEAGAATGGENGVSEADANRIMVEAAQAWEQIPNAGPLFWYTLQDTEDPSSEGFMGLLRRDGSAKPSWATLQQLTTKAWPRTTAADTNLSSAPAPSATPSATSVNVTASGTTASGSVTVHTPTRISAKSVIIAVRDAAGRNWDISLAKDTVLSGQQQFTGSRFSLPPGLYKFRAAYLGSDNAWRAISAEGQFAVQSQVTPAVSVPALSMVSTPQGSTGTATLSTLGSMSARAVILAVRDSGGRNYDIWLAQNVTLTGVQSFTGTKSQLPPGTYTYRVAYLASDGRWYGVGPENSLTVG